MLESVQLSFKRFTNWRMPLIESIVAAAIYREKAMSLIHKSKFLDASLPLYMRLCPSVGPSVSPSVMRSFKTCKIHSG